MDTGEFQWIICECIGINAFALALAKDNLITNEEQALIHQACQDIAVLANNHDFPAPPKSPTARVNQYLRQRLGSTGKKFLESVDADERYDVTLQIFLSNGCLEIIGRLIDFNLTLCQSINPDHIDPEVLYKEIGKLKKNYAALSTLPAKQRAVAKWIGFQASSSKDTEKSLADFVEQLISTAEILMEPEALLPFVKMFAKIRTKKSLTGILVAMESFVHVVETLQSQKTKSAKSPKEERKKLFDVLKEEKKWAIEKITENSSMIQRLL